MVINQAMLLASNKQNGAAGGFKAFFWGLDIWTCWRLAGLMTMQSSNIPIASVTHKILRLDEVRAHLCVNSNRGFCCFHKDWFRTQLNCLMLHWLRLALQYTWSSTLCMKLTNCCALFLCFTASFCQPCTGWLHTAIEPWLLCLLCSTINHASQATVAFCFPDVAYLPLRDLAHAFQFKQQGYKGIWHQSSEQGAAHSACSMHAS